MGVEYQLIVDHEALLVQLSGFGGLERNGGIPVDWTGTVEWNGMECGSIKAHACTVPYGNIIEVLGLWCCIIRILSRGEMGSGDWSTTLPRARANSWYLAISSYFTPLGNTAIIDSSVGLQECDIQVGSRGNNSRFESLFLPTSSK